MAEKMTRITLPGQKCWTGIMDWGRIEPEKMIQQARAYAAHLREQAAAVETAADEDFQVVVVRGSLVQHFMETLQESARVKEARK